MAWWLDGIEEAAFKAVPGGYVFQSPSPWLVARPIYYLVNDAQKAVIVKFIRARVRLAMVLGLLSLVVVIALASGAIWFFRQMPLSPLLLTVLLLPVLLVPMMVVPHLYYMRMLRPIIKDLPTTDQRFPISVQLCKFASAIQKWVLYTGMVGGVLMALGGMIGMYDLISENRLTDGRISPVINMSVGMLLVGFFVYVAVLKKKLERHCYVKRIGDPNPSVRNTKRLPVLYDSRLFPVHERQSKTVRGVRNTLQ